VLENAAGIAPIRCQQPHRCGPLNTERIANLQMQTMINEVEPIMAQASQHCFRSHSCPGLQDPGFHRHGLFIVPCSTISLPELEVRTQLALAGGVNLILSPTRP
jgi:hypothetical protein